MRLSWVVGCVITTAWLWSAVVARGDCPQWLRGQGVPGVNGTIYSSVLWDPDGDGPEPVLLVVGGQFTFAGETPVSNIASWDGRTWRSLASGLTSTTSTPGVFALTVFDGKLVAGGVFTVATPTGTRNNVAMWDGAAWLAVGGLNNQVNALCVHQGMLVAGGLFSSTSDSIHGLASFDGTSWKSIGDGVTFGLGTTTVNALASDGQRLFVGGKFRLAGTTAVSNIAAWDGVKWDDMEFGVVASSSDPGVVKMVMAGRDLIVGGGFTYPGGNEASNIALWNGVYWEPMGSEIASWVYDIFVDSGEVWAVSGSGIWSWDGWGWTALPWNAGTSVRQLLRYDGALHAMGSFATVSPQGYSGVARWSGLEWARVSPGLPRQPTVMTLANGVLYAGFAEGPGGSLLLCWDGNTWFDPYSAGPNYWSSVTALGVHQSELVVAGKLVTRSGALPTRTVVARWRANQWERIGASGETNGPVYVLTSYNGDLIAGGDFGSIDTKTATRLARWDGTAWQPMGGVNGAVRCLGELDGSLIVGGLFSSAGSTAARNVASWTLSQGFRVMGSGLDSTVRAVATMDGVLYAGGSFARTGNTPARTLASWNGTTWVGVPSALGDVFGLSVNNGLVAVGSVVNSSLGSPNIARYLNGAWSGLGSGTVGTPTSIVNFRGEVVIGGTLTKAGGGVSWGFARWTDTGLAPVLESPGSVDVSCGETARFRVRVASGYPGTAYAWRLNGSAVVGNPTAAADALEISAVSHSDDGTYDCVVSTDCGQTVSSGAVLVSTCCPADLNYDGGVDDADFQIFGAAYNLLVCGEGAMPAACPADLNRDGAVDDTDFVLFVVAYDALECP